MAVEPHRRSADAIYERMQTALARAASHGRNPKETAQVGVLKRKWQRFLSMFGERLQFDAKVGLDRHVIITCDRASEKYKGV